MTDTYHGDPLHRPLDPAVLVGFPNDPTKVLQGDGTWGAEGGATKTTQEVVLASTFSSFSTSFVDVTGMSVTMPNRPGGYAIVTFNISTYNGNGALSQGFRAVDGATNRQPMYLQGIAVGNATFASFSIVVPLNGQVVKLQGLAGNGANGFWVLATASLTGNNSSWIETLEIS